MIRFVLPLGLFHRLFHREWALRGQQRQWKTGQETKTAVQVRDKHCGLYIDQRRWSEGIKLVHTLEWDSIQTIEYDKITCQVYM